MTKYLLDTSAVIYLFEQNNQQVIDLLTGGEEPKFWLSTVTRGELAKGVAAATGEIAADRAETKRLAVGHAKWVQPDDGIADHWGRLAAKAARKVANNDLWIAASAVQLAVPLVTGDLALADFADTVGLDVIRITPTSRPA